MGHQTDDVRVSNRGFQEGVLNRQYKRRRAWRPFFRVRLPGDRSRAPGRPAVSACPIICPGMFGVAIS
jgi:hypothetical protein